MIDSVFNLVYHQPHEMRSPEELLKHLMSVLFDGRYLDVWKDGQLVGYLEYERQPLGILHITNCIATEPGVIHELWIQLKKLSWRRLYFRRQKTGEWKHHRRGAYALR